ncbi:MAG: type II toxin-antitoxin system VapC family toxin [Nitrospinae bacterium]|nr:type II toxin-antitoxin system VapC family toxin [Nitrospinota bacterium]
MIALDTNVLVRYLVADDAAQTEAASALLSGLSPENPGFVCREVAVELVWVLERSYRYSREQISAVLEELIASEELEIETSDDLARAAYHYRQGGAGFSDLMIAAAANRRGAYPLYTFDRRAAQMEGVELLGVHAG